MQRIPSPFDSRRHALQAAAGGGTTSSCCSCCVATLVASVAIPYAVFKRELAPGKVISEAEVQALQARETSAPKPPLGEVAHVDALHPGQAAAPAVSHSPADLPPDAADAMSVFLHDARQALDEAQTAAIRVRTAPQDVQARGSLAQVFGTLSQQAHAAGQSQFAQAADAMAKLIGGWPEQRPATENLCRLCDEAVQALRAWLDEDIARGRTSVWSAAAFESAIQRLDQPQGQRPFLLSESGRNPGASGPGTSSHAVNPAQQGRSIAGLTSGRASLYAWMTLGVNVGVGVGVLASLLMGFLDSSFEALWPLLAVASLALVLWVYARAYREGGRLPRNGVLAGVAVSVVLTGVLCAEVVLWLFLIFAR